MADIMALSNLLQECEPRDKQEERQGESRTSPCEEVMKEEPPASQKSSPVPSDCLSSASHEPVASRSLIRVLSCSAGPEGHKAMITPGSFGPPKQEVVVKKKEVANKNSNAIWEEEEVVEAEEIYDPNDTRPAPKYVHRLRPVLDPSIPYPHCCHNATTTNTDSRHVFGEAESQIQCSGGGVSVQVRLLLQAARGHGGRVPRHHRQDAQLQRLHTPRCQGECGAWLLQPSTPHSRCCSLPVRARDERGMLLLPEDGTIHAMRKPSHRPLLYPALARA